MDRRGERRSLAPGPGPLSADEVCRRCSVEGLTFESTDELPSLEHAIGQDRALEALRFGVDIRASDFNVFVCGPAGVGKRELIRSVLTAKAKGEATPADWCYVARFEDGRRPRGLSLPPGRGARFRDDVAKLVEHARATIGAMLEGKELATRRAAIEAETRRPHEEALARLSEDARGRGVALVLAPDGPLFAPLHEGEVLDADAAAKLPDAEQRKISEAIDALEPQLREILRETAVRVRAERDRVEALARELATAATAPLFEVVRREYGGLAEVQSYLDALHADVVRTLAVVSEAEPSEADEEDEAREGPDATERYRVNVLVSHAPGDGAPVVYEDHPTHRNVLGRIEHAAVGGYFVTHHGLIRAGALHRANGGYLVLDAPRLLRDPSVYDALLRALRARQIRLEPPGDAEGGAAAEGLEPAALPLAVRVLLIGDLHTYQRLRAHDPDFGELFKVLVELDGELEWDDAATPRYARLVATLARRHGLLPLDRAAVARVMEYAARAVEHRDKLSLDLRDVGDLLREADHVARSARRSRTGAADVEAALAARTRRADRLRDRVLEEIRRGVVLIDTSGARVGQVNALAVVDTGGFAFGHPARVTARTRLGEGRVIDVERRAHLGGPIHSKGVLILSSFLGARYAPDRPLSLSASLVFEQSYGGVDGDSASGAELCALLSSLSGVPVKQSIAMTGAVSQMGHIQAVGGVNEKIEGFFDVCRESGGLGEHGVVIPRVNVQNLLLREDVVRAVRDGRFHVWAVDSIDEAMEILTGVPAGERGPDGAFPEGSVNQRVEARLIALAAPRAGRRPVTAR